MIEFGRNNWKILSLVSAGLAVLFTANAHLVFVAFSSQPDCVAHSKTSGDVNNSYRAAKSSC